MNKVRIYCPACGNDVEAEILGEVILPHPTIPTLKCTYCNTRWRVSFYEETPNTCEMVLIEDGDLNYWWECSVCNETFSAEGKFEKETESCPNCGSKITDWIEINEYLE